MLKTLIIDDDKMMLDLLKLMLESDEHEIHVASNVSSGRQLIQNNEFDAYAFDVKLPDGNGIDLALEYKKDFADKPVILMSGADLNCDQLRDNSELNISCISKERNGIPEIISFIKKIVENISKQKSTQKNISVESLFNNGHITSLIEIRGNKHFIKDEIITPLENLLQHLSHDILDADFVHHKTTIAVCIGSKELAAQIKKLEEDIINNTINDVQRQLLSNRLQKTLIELKNIQ